MAQWGNQANQTVQIYDSNRYKFSLSYEGKKISACSVPFLVPRVIA